MPPAVSILIETMSLLARRGGDKKLSAETFDFAIFGLYSLFFATSEVKGAETARSETPKLHRAPRN
jgi:hypothetical protein